MCILMSANVSNMAYNKILLVFLVSMVRGQFSNNLRESFYLQTIKKKEKIW